MYQHMSNADKPSPIRGSTRWFTLVILGILSQAGVRRPDCRAGSATPPAILSGNGSRARSLASPESMGIPARLCGRHREISSRVWLLIIVNLAGKVAALLVGWTAPAAALGFGSCPTPCWPYHLFAPQAQGLCVCTCGYDPRGGRCG